MWLISKAKTNGFNIWRKNNVFFVVINITKVKKKKKIRNQCYYAGIYREAHLSCNLSYKNCNFLWISENTEKYVSFSLKKRIKKNDKGKTYTKSCSLRFIDTARFLKALLDLLAIKLPKKIYSQKCKHWKKCHDCKECHECNNDSVNWYNNYNKYTNYQIVVVNVM